MTETRLLVPIEQLGDWPWLDNDLHIAAERAGLDEFDGGEQEGSIYTYFFGSSPVEQVLSLARQVMVKARPRPELAVTGDREITVVVPEQPWLVAYAPAEHPYFRVVGAVSREVASDVALTRWWREHSPYRSLMFTHAHAEPNQPHDPDVMPQQPNQYHALAATVYSNLRFLEEPKPSRRQMRQAAREVVRVLLDAVAEHLHAPRPEITLLDR